MPFYYICVKMLTICENQYNIYKIKNLNFMVCINRKNINTEIMKLIRVTSLCIIKFSYLLQGYKDAINLII